MEVGWSNIIMFCASKDSVVMTSKIELLDFFFFPLRSLKVKSWKSTQPDENDCLLDKDVVNLLKTQGYCLFQNVSLSPSLSDPSQISAANTLQKPHTASARWERDSRSIFGHQFFRMMMYNAGCFEGRVWSWGCQGFFWNVLHQAWKASYSGETPYFFPVTLRFNHFPRTNSLSTP